MKYQDILKKINDLSLSNRNVFIELNNKCLLNGYIIGINSKYDSNDKTETIDIRINEVYQDTKDNEFIKYKEKKILTQIKIKDIIFIDTFHNNIISLYNKTNYLKKNPSIE